MSTITPNPIEVPHQLTTILNATVVINEQGQVVSVSAPTTAGVASQTLTFSTASTKAATITIVNGLITAFTITP